MAADNTQLYEDLMSATESKAARDARPYAVKKAEFLDFWRNRFGGLTYAQAVKIPQWWDSHHSTRKAYFQARKIALAEIQN